MGKRSNALLLLTLIQTFLALGPAHASGANTCDAIISGRLKVFSESVRSQTQESGIFWNSKVLRSSPHLSPERSLFIINQLMDKESALNREVTYVLSDLKLGSSQFWDKFLKVYDRVVPFSHGYLEIFAEAVRVLPKTGRIVDFGAGTGNGAALLAVDSPDRVLVAVDISAEGLSLAKRKLNAVLSQVPSGSAAHRFELQNGDVLTANLAPGSVDGAIMVNVLHAISEDRRPQALKEVFKSLKEGSILVLNDPSDLVQQNSSKLAEFLVSVANSAATNGAPITEYDFAFLGAINIRLLAGGTTKFLSSDDLQALAKSSGFSVESIQSSYYGTGTLLVLKKPHAPREPVD